MLKNQRLHFKPIFIFIVGIGFCFLTGVGCQKIASNTSSQPPQCAHWAILRVAQLCGVPTAPSEIQELLPHHSKGHTFQQE